MEDAAVLSPKATLICRTPLGGSVYLWWGHGQPPAQHPWPKDTQHADTAHHPAHGPVSLRHRRHTLGLSLVDTCNSSLSNKRPHTHLLTDSSITSGSTSHPDTQSQQSCRIPPPEAAGRPSSRPRHWTGPALLVIPWPPGHAHPRAHLSLSVSMGTLFFSQVMRGLGARGFGTAGHTALLAHGGLGMHVEV